MLKRKILTASVLITGMYLHGFTQTATDSLSAAAQDKVADKQAVKAHKDSLRKVNTNTKPIIGIGPGIFNFFGDVNHNKSVNPLVPSFGINLNVSQHLISPSFRVDFNFVMGTLVANEHSAERNLNFRSRVINGSVQATYTFAGLLKPDKVINPYISAGIGVLNFDTKGDLTDKNGATYNYWTDGSIRSIAQTDPLAENAVVIERDYTYETDLRQQNLDSLGKYAQVALTIPLSFGFDFKVSDRLRLKLGSTYYYTFTDLIDNVSSKGSGVRKGTDAKDMFLFSSFTLHYDFFTPKKKVDEGNFKDVDFTGVVENDSDGDGIAEEVDKCPDTPKGTHIDKNGCPLDGDNDGIPDYADMEPKTKKGMPVDAEGYGLTDEVIGNLYKDTVGTNRAKMYEIFPDMRDEYRVPVSNPETKVAEIQPIQEENNVIPADKEVVAELPAATETNTGIWKNKAFTIVDANKDRYISVEEANKMIDDYLDGISELRLNDVYEIIDYLFEQ